ncbi:hypothetical protein Y1Q_0023716 [Alligator mississippiensis]|uniref:Uncharacterized protein n=1 Tax=Alligator mississippiensis TaxID=8496 RepID=A0A151MJX2_ALLMI|nr:hypothetical protein Y1Q_0023716 [Alligator mississippiensis]
MELHFLPKTVLIEAEYKKDHFDTFLPEQSCCECQVTREDEKGVTEKETNLNVYLWRHRNADPQCQDNQETSPCVYYSGSPCQAGSQLRRGCRVGLSQTS